MKEKICPMTVAQAPPAIPQSQAKIKMGSRMVLTIAPTTMQSFANQQIIIPKIPIRTIPFPAALAAAFGSLRPFKAKLPLYIADTAHHPVIKVRTGEIVPVNLCRNGMSIFRYHDRFLIASPMHRCPGQIRNHSCCGNYNSSK